MNALKAKPVMATVPLKMKSITDLKVILSAIRKHPCGMKPMIGTRFAPPTRADESNDASLVAGAPFGLKAEVFKPSRKFDKSHIHGQSTHGTWRTSRFSKHSSISYCGLGWSYSTMPANA